MFNIVSIVLFSVFSIASKDSAQYLTIHTRDRAQKISFQDYKGLELSQNCFKKGTTPECEAFRLSSQKFSVSAQGSQFLGNPASTYCSSMSGTSNVGKSNNGNDIDVCEFSDGSFVKSWSAFYKHYPNKPLKK